MLNISSIHLERRCEVVRRVVGVVPEETPRCADIDSLGKVINKVAKVEAFLMRKKLLKVVLICSSRSVS